MTRTIEMSAAGRIELPARLRRELGLDGACAFEVDVRDGALVLTPVAAAEASDAPELTAEMCLDELHAWRTSRNPGSRAQLRTARNACAAFVALADDDVVGEVLPYAAAIFEHTGYLKDYRNLARFARLAGQLDVLDTVDDVVRRELPDMWIKRALKQGQLDRAVECWFEHEDHPRARLCADPLVRACGVEQVELVISCRMSIVNYRIGRKKRRHYRRACAELRKLRDELEQAGAGEYWQYVLDDVRGEHAGLPALMDELDKAGF